MSANREKRFMQKPMCGTQFFVVSFVALAFGAVVIGDLIVSTDSPAPGRDELEGRMASWPVPSLVQNIRGTWLEDVDKTYFSKMVDAYLYLGSSSLMLVEPRPAEIFSNKGYMEELHRRAAIIEDTFLTDQTNPDKLSDLNFSPFLY